MKRITILLLLTLTITFLKGQIVGVDFSTALDADTLDQHIYKTLIKMKSGYMIAYRQTPVGVKHCLEHFLGEVAVNNSFTSENTTTKDILLDDSVDSFMDYTDLCSSVLNETSEMM